MSSIEYNRLLVKIARLYYEQDMTQAQIGERLRLSRQKVQRLLGQARDEGVVQISIRPIMGTFSDIEKAIEGHFNLREAIVVETTAYEDQPTVAREVGAGAAEYLIRILQPHDKIVISWGGSLLGMVNALFSDPLPKDVEDVMVIQGLGGLGDPNSEVHGSDLTRRLAKALGAQAFLLPAPGVAGSRSAYDALYGDPHVAEALQRARTANLAFMGIGAPRQDSILVREGTIVSWPELANLREQGAVGDMNLRYFDERGQMILSDLDSRVIGLTLDEIRQIGHIVGVAGGSAKLNAIQAALVGKLIDVLVTDHLSAQRLLDVKSEASIAKRVSRKRG